MAPIWLICIIGVCFGVCSLRLLRRLGIKTTEDMQGLVSQYPAQGIHSPTQRRLQLGTHYYLSSYEAQLFSHIFCGVIHGK